MTAAAWAAFFLASPAEAHVGPCAPHEEFLEFLGRQYSETLAARGITADGRLLELTLSGEGNWSVIVTIPGGPSCGVASGVSFEMIAPRAAPPSAPWVEQMTP